MPVDDVAARYAPMAEAAAAGNWRWAFHPRFGMFFPLLSGSIVKLTGANGFRGCQIAALLLFTLSSYPLYGLAIKLFNRAIAIKTMLLCLFCSHLLRFSMEGLRDSGKMLGFALAVYGLICVYQERNRCLGYVYTALGSVLLTLIRGDGALIAMMLLLLMLVLDWRGHNWKIRRSAAAVLLFFILLLPQLLYICRQTGYPVPELRHAQILKKLQIPALCQPELELP